MRRRRSPARARTCRRRWGQLVGGTAAPATVRHRRKTTIAQVQRRDEGAAGSPAMSLVQQYLRRIEALRQERARHQRDRRHQSARRSTRPTTSIAGSRPDGPVGPLHCVPTIVKDNFETIGLQSADGSLSLAGVRVEPRRLPGQAHQGGRRHRAREVEHGGVRVHAVRDRQLDPAGLHEEPLCARPRHRRIERRHGGGGRGELRARRPRHRHRATRSAARPRTRRWSASDRRWA